MVRRRRKNNKYFLNLENHNRKKSCVRRIYNKENKLTSNPKEIINELQGFYENLYHESSNTFLQETEQVFLQSQSIPKLNEEERNSCEGILTINECYQDLKSFADGKYGKKKKFMYCHLVTNIFSQYIK